MKRYFSVILAAFLILSGIAPAFASPLDIIVLEPGLYEVGKDIPEGDYDIRFHGLDNYIVVTFSDKLDENGDPDLTSRWSYQFLFSSPGGWWNPGGFLTMVTWPGYLKIENSPCKLFPED